MREIHSFDKILKDIDKSNKIIGENFAPNDLGGQFTLDKYTFINGKKTFLGTYLDDICADIMSYGKSEEEAKSVVKSAINELVAQKLISPIPSDDVSDGEKAQWAFNLKYRVMEYLKQLGIILF